MDDKELDELLKKAEFMYLSNKNELSFGTFIDHASRYNISLKGKSKDNVITCALKDGVSFCEFAYNDYEYDGKEWIAFYNKNGNRLSLKVN